MHLIDWIIFSLFLLNVVYLLVFSLASKCKKKPVSSTAEVKKKIAILIPAYKEDAVILECVHSCLSQDYPTDKFMVVVISDHMQPETNHALARLPVKLIIATYPESTKSKALNLAMGQIEDSDLALVLDADNSIGPDFLQRINDAFQSSTVRILQAHRMAKNLNNNIALLDAVSEESNNSIFRQGHFNLGLSAALIGSGMVFDYKLFKEKMKEIKAVGGFDRNLELSFLKDGLRIFYLPDAFVYDEKIQSKQGFSNQRRRWMSAQLHYLNEFRKDFPKAVIKGNVDFCLKYLQQMAVPRILLLGLIGLFSVLMTFINPLGSVKWWLLWGLLLLALGMAVPGKMLNKRLLKAMTDLPKIFMLMLLNVFKLKGANKQFIHTQHGISSPNKVDKD